MIVESQVVVPGDRDEGRRACCECLPPGQQDHMWHNGYIPGMNGGGALQGFSMEKGTFNIGIHDPALTL